MFGAERVWLPLQTFVAAERGLRRSAFCFGPPQVFPGEEPPADPEAKQWKFLGGKRQEVYLVMKEGHKQHLWDLEDYDDAAVQKNKTIAEATAEDDDEERDQVANIAAMAFAQGHQHRSEGKAVDMSANAAERVEEEAPKLDNADKGQDSEDSDEEDEIPQTALQAVFGSSRAPQAAPKAGAKAAAAAASRPPGSLQRRLAQAAAQVGAKAAPTPVRAGGRAAPATPAARRTLSAPPTPALQPAPGTPAPLRSQRQAAPPDRDAAERAASPTAPRPAQQEEGGGSGKKNAGRPRAALTATAKKLIDEARELQESFVEGARDLQIQAECDARDKAGQKEWKKQALQEAKAIEATVAKGKKFNAKAAKIPEGQDEELDLARSSLGERCAALEAALRVVRAWRAFNTRLPFRLRFPSIRFRFDSERAPTRFRFDSGATPIRFDLIRMRLRRGPASTPIRFRFVSDSIPIRFRFDSDSIPIRFRFDFDSESIPIRSESDCLPPPFPPRRQRLQLSRARATGCSRTSRLRRRR